MSPPRSSLLLVFLLGLGGPVPEAAAGDDLRVVLQADPAKLVLGKDAQAAIRVYTEGTASEVDLRLHTNVGEITGTTRQADGSFVATYRPPDRFFPQWALVVAVGRQGDRVGHGLLVLPLWGSGEAEVRSKARALVQVSIGEAVFGPVRSDRRGRATIPVTVPPGVTHALSEDRRIDLKVPPMNRLAAVAEDVSLPADGTRRTRIRAYVITSRGRPDNHAQLVFRADRGELTPARRSGEGIYEAVYTPPARVENAKARVSVELTGEAASLHGVDLAIVAGTPARIMLSAEPASFLAGREQPVVLSAQVCDSTDNPTAGDLRITTDLGEVGPLRSLGPGRYQADLRLPGFFEGKREIHLEASVPSGVRAEAFVALRPAEPARIVFSEREKGIVADGENQASVPVAVFDRFGNRRSGSELSAQVGEGEVAGVADKGNGSYTVAYRPPRRRLRGSTTLVVSTGDTEAETRLELLDKPYWVALAAHLGYHTNLKNLHSPYFAAEASVHLPFIERGFYFLAECGFDVSDEEARIGGGQVSSSWWMVSILGSLAYRYQIHPIVDLQASGGPGLFVSIVSNRFEDQPEIEERTLVAGIHFALESGIRLGPGRLSVRIRGLYARLTAEDVVQGNVGGLSILAGYQMGLF